MSKYALWFLAPTWEGITGSRADVDIWDVKPYKPEKIVPYFVLEIDPHFWDWSEKTEFGTFDESGTDTMLRGTLAAFYQMT